MSNENYKIQRDADYYDCRQAETCQQKCTRLSDQVYLLMASNYDLAIESQERLKNLDSALKEIERLKGEVSKEHNNWFEAFQELQKPCDHCGC